MSRFAPVHLPDDRALDGKASMTLLKHYQGCPRAGYFYAATKGAMQTMEMVRGSALHTMFERAIEAMIQQGEPMIPGDLMKSIVNEVLAEQAVPWREHDFIRESAFRWAGEFTCDPSAVIACETLIVIELGDWQVRCKIDLAEALAGGMTVRVRDWKSSRAAPGYEDIARKRPNGTLAAKQFQLILYALALAYGRPVREEPCSTCGEWGKIEAANGEPAGTCDVCAGRGHVEIIEPFPLAAQAETFELELVFPAIEDRDGNMVTRPVTLNRLELGEYRESLIGLLNRLADSERTGDWPAIVSDEACSQCPCRPECPIPAELRNHAGVVNTMEEAVEAAERLDRDSDDLAARRKELKLWAKANDVEIRYGRDKALRFVYGESDRITDKEGMFDAVERARQYGEPFDRSKYVKTVGSTAFKPVTLTEDELAEEAGEEQHDG